MKYGKSSGWMKFARRNSTGSRPELVDRGIDQALDHEVRDLGAEAAIGALLALVGEHGGDVDLDAADLVGADDLRERVAVMADAELEIGAVVVDHLAAQAGHPAVRVERQLGVVDPVGAVVVGGGDVVDPVLDVFDRPAGRARQRRGDHRHLVEKKLAAEAAAGERRDDVELVRRDARARPPISQPT